MFQEVTDPQLSHSVYHLLGCSAVRHNLNHRQNEAWVQDVIWGRVNGDGVREKMDGWSEDREKGLFVIEVLILSHYLSGWMKMVVLELRLIAYDVICDTDEREQFYFSFAFSFSRKPHDEA